MSLRLRRGTDSTRTSITPVQGEPIYTTDTKKLYIGDGTTAGGIEIGGGASVSASGNNRVITSDGTATGLNGELNLTFDGSTLIVVGNVTANSFTGSLQGTATTASYVLQAVSSSFATTSNTASYILNSVSSSFASTASYVINSVSSSFAINSSTASYVLNSISSSLSDNSNLLGGLGIDSFAKTGSNTFNANQVISGSLTITQNLTVFGSSSLTYVTASQLAVSTSFISVNVFEPAQRFGGLIVYDSGSSQATASLAWDSQHNHWVYQNASDGGYSGGMLIAGPRNTGSLGDESELTTNYIPKSQGGDHIIDSNISDTGTLVNINSNTTITGSLSVTSGITGSLRGVASTASYYGGTVTSASFATTSNTASYVLNSVSSSFATTASFARTANSASVATSASYAVILEFPQNQISNVTSTTTFFINTDINQDPSSNRNVSYPELLTDIAGTNLASDGDSINLNTTVTGLTSVTSTSFTGSLQGTATTASYVLQAVSSSFATTSSFVRTAYSSSVATTASYVLQAVSASFATTASYVNPLVQNITVTGSILITGSKTIIGQSYLTGSLYITGSESIVGYIGLEPVGGLVIPTNKSASYIYTSGSTNDLWFTQYQGPYTNSTRLRWLESNLSTGLLYGGILSSTTGSTQFTVTAGEGVIVSQNAFTGSSPYPTIKLVSWSTQTLPITNSGSAKLTYVGVNNTGTIVQQTAPWGSTDINQFDSEIELGIVLHLSGSVSTGVFNSPQVGYAHPQQADDFMRSFGPLKISGHTLQASGSTLSIIKSGGRAFLGGANYLINPNHPSTVIENAVTVSKIYRYYTSGSTSVFDTGINNAGYTVIDPTKRVDTTTGLLTTVNPAKFSLQRVFWVPNSPREAFIVYYGNAQYDSLIDALNAKDTEPFAESDYTATNAIFLGWIALSGGASSLTNPVDATIAPAGIFRSIGGIGSTGTTPVSTTLAGLSDVSVASRTDGDLLYYNGSQWVNSKSLTGNYSISGSLTVGTTTISNGSITGSLQGSSSYATTASYALQALSSSFATNSLTASYWSGTVTSASYASTASYWSGTVTSASYALNSTSASYSRQQFTNVQVLSGTKTILSTDPSVQMLNPNGAVRQVVLPTNSPTGSKFEIWNMGSDTSNNYLAVGDGVYYVYNVDPGRKITVTWTGVDVFTGPGYPWAIDGAGGAALGLSIGETYNNYNQGVGVGYAANNNYDGGLGVGRGANNNFNGGVGVGYGASSNYQDGVGVGYSANSNYTYGIGIGFYAANNSTYGIGIGYQSSNAYSYGTALGAWTNGNGKGVGTVAIGAYSTAQRQNEFVTTGTDATTNKAQSIIQKFRNKALSSASSAFQEIFTDASSGRLTILASSVYQFRIQINAIEATGFKCKTWEITGAIKRNASNSTTMIGGAPTYYITSEDSGTSNWDVRVTADDTNEALKIEVKHDSANNVTFSATVWATETRL